MCADTLFRLSMNARQTCSCACSNLSYIISKAEETQQMTQPTQELIHPGKKPGCCLLVTLVAVFLLIIAALVAIFVLHEYGRRKHCHTPNVQGYTFRNAKSRYPLSNDLSEVEVDCAPGFYGKVTVTPCSNSRSLFLPFAALLEGRQEYSVSGCSENLCEPLPALPKGMIPLARNGKTGSDYVACAAGVRLSAGTKPYCNATCRTDYRQVHTNAEGSQGHNGFVCPSSGGQATPSIRCVRQNFCAPIVLGDGVATTGDDVVDLSAPSPCTSGLELQVGDSCSVKCDERTHRPGQDIRTCEVEGSAPTSRLQCSRKTHCAALELAAGLVGTVIANASECRDGMTLRAGENCAVKCDESGPVTGAKYRRQTGHFRCPSEGGTATTDIICTKQVRILILCKVKHQSFGLPYMHVLSKWIYCQCA